MPTNDPVPYPKSVFFIISNEFCERFSYYGMKTVLTLFLSRVLLFTENGATQIYHTFSGLCYFTPVFGAMLADSGLGKYHTILYLSLVYVLGNVVLSVAAIPSIGTSALVLTMIGLLLIGVGTGGIKPCVAAFGGDQFKLPQQALQLATFFSVFYFSINAGSLVSTFLTPKFRELQCFGHDCYLLAFSVPAVLMVIALMIFVLGRKTYIIKQSDGNVVAKVAKCISHAIARKGAEGGSERSHWLDYADDKFDKGLIEDIKVILKLFVLYIPLPFFWALFDQQGSRWTFQATRMTGELFSGIQILPDQMQIVNPLLILLLIPIFDQLIYPCFSKMGLLKKPLQRLTIGGILAGLAFVVSGILELKIQTQYPVGLRGNESTFNFINHVPCSMALDLTLNSGNSSATRELLILPNGMVSSASIPAGDYSLLVKYVPSVTNLTQPGNKFDCKNWSEWNKTFSIEATGGMGRTHVLAVDSGKKLQLTSSKNPDKLMKEAKGDCFVKVFYSGLDPEIKEISLNGSHPLTIPLTTPGNGQTEFLPVKPYEYSLSLLPSGAVLGEFYPRLEGVYVLTLNDQPGGGSVSMHEYTIVPPNDVHMFWLLPQYIIITIGEVMFSVTGLEFSYSQAPASMKSVIQAAWLLTVAFGNVIVLIISGAHIFDEQAKEFFLFAGLMFLDMLIFAFLAIRYKPVHNKAETEEMASLPPAPDGYINKAMEERSM